jgi:hypothetical protein
MSSYSVFDGVRQDLFQGCSPFFPFSISWVGVELATIRASRLTSRVTIAKRKLTENPHINTPTMLSSGPSIRQFRGKTTSPIQRWHNLLQKNITPIPGTEDKTNDSNLPTGELAARGDR